MVTFLPCLEAHLPSPSQLTSPSELYPVFIPFVLVNTMRPLPGTPFFPPEWPRILQSPQSTLCFRSFPRISNPTKGTGLCAVFELPQRLLTESHGRPFSENLRLLQEKLNPHPPSVSHFCLRPNFQKTALGTPDCYSVQAGYSLSAMLETNVF